MRATSSASRTTSAASPARADDVDPVRAAIIGCGNVSAQYLAAAPHFAGLEIVACSDLQPGVAEALAARHGLRALTPEALLGDPEIELVINLTVPAAHVAVGLGVLEAGKHLYSEKPLAISLTDGRRLVETAAARGLRLGCAPDTFLGGGHQHVRHLIDAGRIGRVVGGSCFVMSHGMEHWHPNPAFFFQTGGGPILDMGPYYVAALVNLLGPVRTVAAAATRGRDERIVTSAPRAGERIAVEVATHVSGVMTFAGGAVISLTASWDVWRHEHNRIELYGTDGTLIPPDPNFFGGAARVSREGADFETIEPEGYAFVAPNFAIGSGAGQANYRSVGVVDMAWAIREGRPHRASAELALHTLEVLEAFERSAAERRHVEIESACGRPEPLPKGEGEEVLQTGPAEPLAAPAA
jgi:predicted dehydrogenase